METSKHRVCLQRHAAYRLFVQYSLRRRNQGNRLRLRKRSAGFSLENNDHKLPGIQQRCVPDGQLTGPSITGVRFFRGGTAGIGPCLANGAVACTAYGYDESPSPSGAHGNQTSVNRWLNTTGTSLKSATVFNSDGTINSTTDPNLNTTTYAYVSPGYAGSGPYVDEECP